MSTNAHLSVTAITLAVGLVIPLITSILSREKAPEWVKYLITAGLSATSGVLVPIIHGGTTTWDSLVTNVGVAWGASIVSHTGMWLPTGTAAKLEHWTAAFGLGKPQVAEAEAALASVLPAAVVADVEKVTGIHAVTVTATSTPSTPASPVDPATVAAEVTADAAPVVAAVEAAPADVPAAVAEAAAPVVADVAPALTAVGVPAAAVDVAAAVAADAPAIEAEAQVDPKAAAVQGVKDALDALLKAVA
jgi:hypothetical protein